MDNLRGFLKRNEEGFLEVIVLTAFCFLASQQALRITLVTDPDIWWHLRTAQWIFEHGAFPTTDPFSIAGQAKSWVAYSWLFEILLYGLHRVFGLMGFVIYTVILALGIVSALLVHIRQLVPIRGESVVYTLFGIITLVPLMMPRPWLFSVLFFILVYTLLLAAKRRGNDRLLRWLPLIFIFWANLHIQFIYGLFLLCFDTAEPLIERLLRRDLSVASLKANLDARRWRLVLFCFAATLATPYNFKLYVPIFEYTRQTGVFRFVEELRAPDFQTLATWAAFGLTVWAIFRIGWHRVPKRSVMLLLLIGVAISFRSRRDLWFVATIAITTIASMSSPPNADRRALSPRLSRLAYCIAILATCLMLSLMVRSKKITEDALQQEVARNFPVAAARVIAERGYPGPMYNQFNWGGYIIWRLPWLPVSMDGRTNLYGEGPIERNTKVWRGDPSWIADPELASARVVLADVTMPLCELLRHDRRFDLVYEDAVAAVFVHYSR